MSCWGQSASLLHDCPLWVFFIIGFTLNYVCENVLRKIIGPDNSPGLKSWQGWISSMDDFLGAVQG